MAEAQRDKAASIQATMDKLPLGDAIVLKQSLPYSSAIDQCYNVRKDPVRYLSNTFRYPLTLLSAMFDSGCILSGSRALEYFIPGSCRPESDWDFYVPGYKESVTDMVKALGICGVSWNLKGDDFMSKLSENRSVLVGRSTLEFLQSWFKDESNNTNQLFNEQLEAVIQLYAELQSDVKQSSNLF